LKEAAYYEQEVKENESTLEEMKSENRDPYDIKKFQEVLDESHMMIPDSKSRLKQTLAKLKTVNPVNGIFKQEPY
jgi:tubulin-specific chaperone A